MSAFVVRVWLPDRPGALGAVASRIGAVRGDLVGIDILERESGRAIDELIVDLPDASLVPLLERELAQVDGVEVEDIRPVADIAHDPRLDALATAISLVESPSVELLLRALVERAARDFEADWAAVIDGRSPDPLSSTGRPPGMSVMLDAIRTGSPAVAGGTGVGDEVAWSTMSAADLTLVLGRRGRAFRARERRQATALARIADARWTEMVVHRAR